VKPPQNLTDSLNVLGRGALVKVVLRIDDYKTRAQSLDKSQKLCNNPLESRPEMSDKIDEDNPVHPSVRMVADSDERTVRQIPESLRAA